MKLDEWINIENLNSPEYCSAHRGTQLAVLLIITRLISKTPSSGEPNYSPSAPGGLTRCSQVMILVFLFFAICAHTQAHTPNQII